MLERLKSGGGLYRIELLQGASHDSRVATIIDLSKSRGTEVKFRDRKTLDRSADGAAHQGCIGYCSDFTYCDVDDIFEVAKERDEPPFIVILDGIEDPHNLGSIMRSAECGGVHGLIIGKNRQVPVTDTVIKVAEGAAEHVKIARVVNINDAVRELKTRGVWVYALDADGTDIYAKDISGAAALVVGAEGKGVSRLTREICDGVLALPMRGQINSLNAAVAAALGIYRKIECDALAVKK